VIRCLNWRHSNGKKIYYSKNSSEQFHRSEVFFVMDFLPFFIKELWVGAGDVRACCPCLYPLSQWLMSLFSLHCEVHFSSLKYQVDRKQLGNRKDWMSVGFKFYVHDHMTMWLQLQGYWLIFKWETMHNIGAAVVVYGKLWAVQLEQPW